MGESNTEAEIPVVVDLNVALRKIEADMDVAKGVERTVKETDRGRVTTLVVTRPGSYDETPETFILKKTVPQKATEATTTELVHTWRTKNVDRADVENRTQTITFSTTHKLIGGISETTVKGAEKYAGTKPIYRDTNSVREGGNIPIDNPIKTANEIISMMKSPPTPVKT